MEKRWWYVEANRTFCGRIEATESEMRAALGPHVSLYPNGLCIVLSRPNAAQETR